MTGAKVKIHESAESANERTVEIIGSAEQVTAAQQLVQAFIVNSMPPNPRPQGNQGYVVTCLLIVRNLISCESHPNHHHQIRLEIFQSQV